MTCEIDGVMLWNGLLCDYGYLVCEGSNKLSSDSSYVRLAARPAEQVEALLDALSAALRIRS